VRQDYEFQLIGDLSEIRIPFVRSEDPHAEAGHWPGPISAASCCSFKFRIY